jgi:hypothetical protein
MQSTSTVSAEWATAYVLLGLALVTAACLLASRSMSSWNQPLSMSVWELWITALVTVTASSGKVLAVYVTRRLCRIPAQDSVGLGVLMNTRGLTELVILSVGRASGVLSARMFTILAVMAVATTLITGPVMGRIYSDLTVRSAQPRWRLFGRRRQDRAALSSKALSSKGMVMSRSKQLPEADLSAVGRDIGAALTSAQLPAPVQPSER